MTARPILYSFRRCPFAMRARMALLASDTPVEIREVVLRAKPPELAAASPKATVPVLVLADGRAIDESLDIMRWALARHDPEAWLAADDAALIARNDGAFKHHLDRYKYPERHGADPIEHRDAAATILADLDARLAGTGFLRAPRRTLADIAIFPFVRQFAATDPAWFAARPWPRLQAWLATLTGSALFDRAMIRLAPWAAGDAPTMFPRAGIEA